VTGRESKFDRMLVHHFAYGDAIGPGTTQVLFQMDNQSITPFSWCPALPRAAKAVRVAVTSQCAVNTTPGNWTLRLRKNESVVADEATFSVAVTTALATTVGPWSAEALFQAGDRYYIVADGPSKDTVILRVVLEWEIL
jgi:hypothetical protein